MHQQISFEIKVIETCIFTQDVFLLISFWAVDKVRHLKERKIFFTFLINHNFVTFWSENSFSSTKAESFKSIRPIDLWTYRLTASSAVTPNANEAYERKQFCWLDNSSASHRFVPSEIRLEKANNKWVISMLRSAILQVFRYRILATRLFLATERTHKKNKILKMG